MKQKMLGILGEGAGNFTSEEEEECELEQQVEHAEGTECCIMCGLTMRNPKFGLSARCA